MPYITSVGRNSMNGIDGFKKAMFVSPHFDDAILSCGGLISNSIQRGKSIQICTVFTEIQKENNKLSQVIKKYVAEDMGILESNVDIQECEKWITLRRQEDERACKYLGCKKRELKYLDAIFRLERNQYIYDTEESLFKKAYETTLVNELIEQFIVLCKDFDVCFFPMAIGSHIDHRILHRVGLSIAKRYNYVYYYHEIPYCIGKEMQYSKENQYDISESMKYKIKAISYYDTQLKGLFGCKEGIGNIIPAYEVYSKKSAWDEV